MSEINALYSALHRSFAAIRRGDRIEAERWLKIAERVGNMQRALKLLAKADVAEQMSIDDLNIDDDAGDEALT